MHECCSGEKVRKVVILPKYQDRFETCFKVLCKVGWWLMVVGGIVSGGWEPDLF